MSTVPSTIYKNESGLKAYVKRHQLLAMYILMFVMAYPGLILEVLYSQGITASQSPVIVSLFIGWGPAVAAVLVSAFIAGRPGVRELLRRFLVWRLNIVWYAVALFLLAGLILGGIGLHVLFGGAVPAIPAASASILDVALSFIALIVFGILINTEEVAWRGFTLPRLQARYGALAASVLLVIPEALLHLPYFWNRDVAFYQTVGIFWFSAFSVAMVFIYTYVFNKTGGSLLIVTLMHASQNAWANLLSDNTARPFQFTVALAWMIAIALIFLTRGQLGYEERDNK
jgi:uncharacterized protein